MIRKLSEILIVLSSWVVSLIILLKILFERLMIIISLSLFRVNYVLSMIINASSSQVMSKYGRIKNLRLVRHIGKILQLL